MKNTKLQALIASALGDGCLRKQANHVHLQFSSIYKENCIFRLKMLGHLHKCKVKKVRNNGYKKSFIYKFRTKIDKDFEVVYNMNLEHKLENIDKLGLAMWFYDDGSLHKSSLFYNLNTHSFTKEEHINYLIPFFRKLELNPILSKDKSFYYLRFNKSDNAVFISDLLNEYLIEEMSYKCYPSNAYLKGFEYKNQYYKSRMDLRELGLSVKQIHNLSYSTKQIKKINYFDVQRLSKPNFWQ